MLIVLELSLQQIFIFPKFKLKHDWTLLSLKELSCKVRVSRNKDIWSTSLLFCYRAKKQWKWGKIEDEIQNYATAVYPKSHDALWKATPLLMSLKVYLGISREYSLGISQGFSLGISQRFSLRISLGLLQAPSLLWAPIKFQRSNTSPFSTKSGGDF